MKKSVRGLIVLLLVVAGLGTICTIGTRTHQGCTDCGIRRNYRTLLGVAMPIEQRTARADWYDRRIGGLHDHRWTRLSCTRGFNLWGGTTVWACGRPDAYPGDDATLTVILTRLEPLGLDIPFHNELTHQDGERRMTAASAARKFDPTWKKEDVWRWWEEAGWPWPARR